MNECRLTLQDIEAEPMMTAFEKQCILELLRYDSRLYVVRGHDGQLSIVGIKLNERGLEYLERGKRLVGRYPDELLPESD